jgi:hypothetical protein
MTGSDWALPQRIMMRPTGQPVHVRRAPSIVRSSRAWRQRFRTATDGAGSDRRLWADSSMFDDGCDA